MHPPIVRVLRRMRIAAVAAVVVAAAVVATVQGQAPEGRGRGQRPTAAVTPPGPPPQYSIEAIRFGIGPKKTQTLVATAGPDEMVDIAFMVLLIRGGGKNILFDSGLFQPELVRRYEMTEFIKPDEAVRRAGVRPEDVTDVIISHSHYDHMGGIELFPNATLWIQKQEYEYYTGAAWQPGGRPGGVTTDILLELVRRNLKRQVRFIDGDDKEFLPGIRAYTGARHTYASQYVRVQGLGQAPVVLASDNCYLYRNIAERAAGFTFDPGDRPASVAALDRMVTLAGSAARVIPGHEMLVFKKFPTNGNIARIQ